MIDLLNPVEFYGRTFNSLEKDMIFVAVEDIEVHAQNRVIRQGSILQLKKIYNDFTGVVLHFVDSRNKSVMAINLRKLKYICG